MTFNEGAVCEGVDCGCHSVLDWLILTIVGRADKTCKTHACMQPIFFYKTWKIQTFSLHVFRMLSSQQPEFVQDVKVI